MEEKSYLQTIKLEISKNVKLEPYERIAFHKLLGLHRTDPGMNTLSLELNKSPLIRRNALNTLSRFEKKEALEITAPLLSSPVSSAERMMILDSLRRSGSPGDVPVIINFIESIKNDIESLKLIQKGFEALSNLGQGMPEVLDFVLSIIKADDIDKSLKLPAIQVLSAFKSISTYEDLLKRDDDSISYEVYSSLYSLITKTIESTAVVDVEEERLYTYSPDSEDKIILDIRVLLGKMAPRFDGYSNLTKITYISAMIACSHREFLIYAMKALTSKDQELITMALYTLHKNISRIRDPDKLFRSLISLSSETERDSDLIVGIFIKFFSAPKNTRQYHLLQDKMYSYIIVTMETYFETYRKEFMITDVIEKSLPESFQKVRLLMLERLSPDLRKKIVAYLTHDDAALVSHIISDISKWLAYIDEGEKESLTYLLDILSEKDKKSRENSASRIDDLNYEKRYLRDRIIRLCSIIEKLGIKDAASVLVNIYNYLKKYHDEKIIEAATHALASLNYSYMLGEIEVMLSAGSDREKLYSVHLLSLFTEQRSLNIIFEILQSRIEENSPLVKETLSALREREIKGNGTASQILKAIIERNGSKEIRCIAILCLGKCCFETDIDFLHTIFFNKERDEPKDEIVRAIGEIAVNGLASNKRQLIKSLQDYLKDPGIKVRIYSCFLLAFLGYKEAHRSIRDMLVIKNKDIQRDMLTLLIKLKSLDFGFFLISLLTSEYGITDDIVTVLGTLGPEDLKEIDSFVVNMFQKYERPDIEGLTPQAEQREVPLRGLKDAEVTILYIDVIPQEGWDPDSIPDIISLGLWIREYIIAGITQRGGTIASMASKKVVAVFQDPLAAIDSSMKIISRVKEYGLYKPLARMPHVYQYVETCTVRMINEELIEQPDISVIDEAVHPFHDRIVLSSRTMEKIKTNYSLRKIPEIALNSAEGGERYELISQINFLDVADEIIQSIAKDEEKKQELQQKIEAEIKKLKIQSRSTSSVTIARDLDIIGSKLQELLDDIDRYVQKRSTDRELIRNVTKLLANVYNLYKVEISRIIIE